MPTVPPKFVSFDSDDVLVQHACAVADIGDALSTSPTPDPELDERMLVSVVTGDGVGAISSPDSLAGRLPEQSRSLKPHINLANLSLHSPSSIVGTPFDVSPRFEYPFPPSMSNDEPEIYISTALNAITSPFMPYPSSMAFSSSFTPSPPPAARVETRGYSPTHPKLQRSRDPPVPPSLAKKRWRTTISGPAPVPPSHSRKRSRSNSAGIQQAPDGADGSTATPSHERGSSVESAAHSDAERPKPQRRLSRAHDTPSCRPGKEPEGAPCSPPAGPRASPSSKTPSPERRPGVPDAVPRISPESYPDLAPSATAIRSR